jgi:hypothetical protein
VTVAVDARRVARTVEEKCMMLYRSGRTMLG